MCFMYDCQLKTLSRDGVAGAVLKQLLKITFTKQTASLLPEFPSLEQLTGVRACAHASPECALAKKLLISLIALCQPY